MLDVVIWGATGYTGKLIANYFASNVARRLPRLRWGIGGRSHARLTDLHDQLCSDHGEPLGPAEVLIAPNGGDRQEFDRLTARTRVVIAAAGPFSEIGTPLVSACLDNGCDYVCLLYTSPSPRDRG